MPKNIQTTAQFHLFHMLARWYSKFSKLDFNSMWTENFQMFKLDLEKTKEAAIKLPTYLDHRKSKRYSRKTSISASLTPLQSLCGLQQTGKFWKRWKYQTTLYVFCETCMQQGATVRTWYGTMDWFQIKKGVHQGCILSPAYLTYMQSTSSEMPGWMKHKLESILLGEISITSDMEMTPPLWQKV